MPRQGLIPKKKTITRGGKTFLTTVYVREGEENKGSSTTSTAKDISNEVSSQRPSRELREEKVGALVSSAIEDAHEEGREAFLVDDRNTRLDADEAVEEYAELYSRSIDGDPDADEDSGIYLVQDVANPDAFDTRLIDQFAFYDNNPNHTYEYNKDTGRVMQVTDLVHMELQDEDDSVNLTPVSGDSPILRNYDAVPRHIKETIADYELYGQEFSESMKAFDSDGNEIYGGLKGFILTGASDDAQSSRGKSFTPPKLVIPAKLIGNEDGFFEDSLREEFVGEDNAFTEDAFYEAIQFDKGGNATLDWHYFAEGYRGFNEYILDTAADGFYGENPDADPYVRK